MTKRLTEKQAQKYLENPNYCPFCKSEWISAGGSISDDNFIIQEVSCDNCGEEWQDEYTLTGVMDNAKNSTMFAVRKPVLVVVGEGCYEDDGYDRLLISIQPRAHIQGEEAVDFILCVSDFTLDEMDIPDFNKFMANAKRLAVRLNAELVSNVDITDYFEEHKELDE